MQSMPYASELPMLQNILVYMAIYGICTLIAAMTGNRWMRGLNMTCTRPLIFSFSMPAYSSIAFKHVVILTVHT